MSTASTPKAAHVTAWDRAVVIALAGAGCALSYDALQQMAVAIHVRGFLTYLFPPVIDGFIAYGIRALHGPARRAPARPALRLDALRHGHRRQHLGQRPARGQAQPGVRPDRGLRLGNTVVAVLSTIAPLALAGAVHLYILIARGPVKDSDRGDLGRAGRPRSG